MDTVKIGWGKREVSMDGPVQLPGQMHLRVSKRILDPLYATALCVDGGEGQDVAIFCACDAIFLSHGVHEEVQAKVAEMNPQIPTENILINATHTHTSGGMTHKIEKDRDGNKLILGKDYRAFFVQQAAEAIVEAWDSRKEGGIAYGYGYATTGHSRRTVYFEDMGERNKDLFAVNGHGMMYGDTKDPLFSHYEAGMDSTMNVMYTVDADEKLTGMIINVPCPSQCSEMFVEQSADYWDDVRKLVAERFGPDVYVLNQCAAAGDLAPRRMHYKEAEARRFSLKYDIHFDPAARGLNEDTIKRSMAMRRDIALRIVNCAEEVFSWAKKDIRTQVPVCHHVEDVHMDKRRVTDAEYEWCKLTQKRIEESIPDPATCTPAAYKWRMSQIDSAIARVNSQMARYENWDEADSEEILPIHTIRIGDVGFASNPYEMYMDFMHRLQARSPFIQTFVVQLAGSGYEGYLSTERATFNKGYSASMTCNTTSYDGGQQWVEGCLKSLEKLAEK